MLPINNGDTSPCSHISSNCVVWQGPDIPCIGLCNGDTVSDVIAKLAEKLCDILDQAAVEPDLTGMDLACVLPDGQSAPTSVADTMQLIIDYVCSIGSTPEYTLPIINLPACLHYTPEGRVDQVNQLPLDEYAELLATEICDILTRIATIEATVLDHESRIVILENCVLPCASKTPDEVLSSCLFSGDTKSHSDMILALETAYCNLEDAVGSTALIAAAINATSCITGSTTRLNGTGTYGSLENWVNNPATLAETVQNAWVVLCDMYAAIEDIKLTCCPGACDSVVFGATATAISNSVGVTTSVSVVFRDSSIPAGYSDCGGSTTITLTDSNGATVSSIVNVSALAGGLTATQLSTEGLNVYDDLDVSIAFCVTDDTNTCSETFNTTISLGVPCPTDVQATSITEDALSVTFSNYLGSSASYVIQIIKTATGLAVDSATITSPGTSVIQGFSGLEANTAYQIKVTAQISGKSSECSAVSFTTLDDSVPCDEGIDCVVIMDYTGSMGDVINDAKTGAASLVTTVDNAAGTNIYRFGLVIADEVYDGNLPNYADNTDYASLPSAQKYSNTTSGPTTDTYITAMELMSNDNGTSYQTQLNKLNNTMLLGSGASSPEPMDRALDLVINNDFVGAFRSNVAKYVIMITDDLPGGFDDTHDASDVTFVQSLQATCIAQGIKVVVLGSGANYNVWQSLAINTGGSYDASFDASSIEDSITNLCGGSSSGGGSGSSTTYTVQSCSGTGTVYNVTWPSTLTIGQSVKLSIDGGAGCYMVTGYTTNAPNATILTTYSNCTNCLS